MPEPYISDEELIARTRRARLEADLALAEQLRDSATAAARGGTFRDPPLWLYALSGVMIAIILIGFSVILNRML